MLVAISITLQIKSTAANLLILHKVRNLFPLVISMHEIHPTEAADFNKH